MSSNKHLQIRRMQICFIALKPKKETEMTNHAIVNKRLAQQMGQNSSASKGLKSLRGFDFKNHLSPSLLWKWHLQDFIPDKIDPVAEDRLTVRFRPRFQTLCRLGGFVTDREAFPVTALSSMKLSLIASIIGAGAAYRKDRKDGEVILHEFNQKCRKPLLYQHSSVIPVTVEIDHVRTTEKFSFLRSYFTIGDEMQHSGDVALIYCKPGLSDFSYL